MVEVIKEAVQTSGKYDDVSDDELWEQSQKEHGIEGEEAESDDSDDVEETTTEEDEGSEESQESDETTENDDEVDDPFFKGKTKKELVDIVKKNNTYVSQVKNELHNVKDQIAKINDASTKKEVAEAKDELDEILAGYKPEDVSAIMKIVNKAISTDKEKTKKDELQATESELKANEKLNEDFWDVYQFANPEAAKKIEKKLLKSINVENLQKKDFVKDFITESQSDKGSSKSDVNSEGLIKKKREASTSTGSGSGALTGKDGSFKGKPEPTDPDDYVKWLEENKGIKI